MTKSPDTGEVKTIEQRLTETITSAILTFATLDEAEIFMANRTGDEDYLAYKAQLESIMQGYATAARINENEIMQHQAFNILKTGKAVGQWSELRVKQLRNQTGDE